MRIFIALACLVVAVVAADEKKDGAKKYTTKYDHMDADQVLKSDRLVTNYVNCMMDRGRCTPDAKEMKDNLPDALKNECKGCSPIQKKNAAKVMTHLITKRKDAWEEIQAKYDPDHIYIKKYKKVAEEHNIKLPPIDDKKDEKKKP